MRTICLRQNDGIDDVCHWEYLPQITGTSSKVFEQESFVWKMMSSQLKGCPEYEIRRILFIKLSHFMAANDGRCFCKFSRFFSCMGFCNSEMNASN